MQLPAPITHGCPEVRKAQKVVASASAASSRSIPKPADLNETDFLNATEGWLEFGPASSADAGMVYPGMELWQTANGGRSWIRKDQIPGQSRIVAGTAAFTSRNDGWMRGESPRARLDAYHERRTHLVQGDTRSLSIYYRDTPYIWNRSNDNHIYGATNDRDFNLWTSS